jgi:hypothetical protein
MATKKDNIAVLSVSEYERIKKSCAIFTESDNREKQNRRKQQHELSKQKVRNWKNTLEASRKKREEDKLKALIDEEV